MTETIQQLKEDIAVLQEKLNKLEEIEKQPKMTLIMINVMFVWTIHMILFGI
jgi:hypothetical protein